ncbi:MAG: metallophosphoesterase [Deltaproteobacteria bacterium]|nr:metallophosphoesterase [Deltaproteobacteria bacterium]
MSSRTELAKNIGTKGRKLLVVSDMHVGRDQKLITGFAQGRPNPAFDRAFVDLLDLYTAGKEGDWKLILAGDFIDFLEVVVVRDDRRRFLLSFDVTNEEQEFGLGTAAERVLEKLYTTLEYHQDLFARLARFVKGGGEIVVMRGNHDVEFYWPKVQRAFRRELASLAFRDDPAEIDDDLRRRSEFQSRVIFAPWIYFEPGRIYVEHGHQYDEYCSFDHWLYPVSPTNPRMIDTPVSAFAMRFFVNMMSDYTADHVETWGWRDYLSWAREKGPGGALYTVRMGLVAGLRIVWFAGQWTFGRVGRYNQEHKKRLVEEANRFGIDPEKLERIDNLHHLTVIRNLPELMRLLFLDRVLLAVGAMFLVFLVLLFVERTWLELVGIGFVFAAALRANKSMLRHRFLLPGPKQARAADKIAETLEVPVVVMGHSHVRRNIPLPNGRTYLNTGCWLPPFPTQDHLDPQAPCTCKLSHMVLESESRPELRVFCKAQKTVRLADLPPRTEEREQRSGSLPDIPILE